MAINIKVSIIGLLDALKFKNLKKARAAGIEAAPSTPLPEKLTTNEKAKLMHPESQLVRIKGMNKNGADAVTVVLESVDGKALAPFRAGQYISVSVDIGETATTRSYSLCSSPAWAWDGIYHITVKRVEDDGFVSKFIQDEWKVGQELYVSDPQGNLFYEPIRDCKKVVALAGGSGITPFVGMARAICDGYEDFDLTIIYGSRVAQGIVYKQELDEICAACDKVHAVYVLSDEEADGFEHGFISADIIRKYAEDNTYTVFMCGPQAMYNFLDGETAKIGLKPKYVRRELFGTIKDPWNQPNYPMDKKGKTYTAKVVIGPAEYEIPALADEPLLVAFERAGIKAPSRCRSGECGWCRSRLLSGEVFIPEKTDGRRWADKEYGYIHPCSSFPISDLVVEVPGQYLK